MAQSKLEFGLLPSININKKLPRDWSVNFKGESRQSFYREQLNYDYLLTDFSVVAAKKASINTTFSAGYLLRMTENGTAHRAIQQVSAVQRYYGFRIGHRLLTDQTFQSEKKVIFRVRYRASSEIPLSGQSLDPREFFIKLNNEYLGEWQGGEFDLEIRLGSFLGYYLPSSDKLEIGLDYRLDSFVTDISRQRCWIGLNYYTSF